MKQRDFLIQDRNAYKHGIGHEQASDAKVHYIQNDMVFLYLMEYYPSIAAAWEDLSSTATSNAELYHEQK